MVTALRATQRWGSYLTISIALIAVLAFLSLIGVGTASAGSSNPKEDCIRTGTAKPHVIRAEITHPGDRRRQSIEIEARYKPMPRSCVNAFTRVAVVKFQVENPADDMAWFSEQPFEGLGGEEGPIADQGGVGVEAYGGRVESDPHYYQCAPGPRVTKVRTLLLNKVKSVATHQVVGQKLFDIPVRFHAPSFPLPQQNRERGAVQHAC